MTWGDGEGRDELAVQCRPPLDPSTVLRVSGPSLMDSGSGGGMTEGKGRHETCACGGGGKGTRRGT